MHGSSKARFYWLLLLLLPALTQAADVLRLGTGSFDLPIREQVDILLDADASLTAAGLARDGRNFRQARTRDLALDFTRGRYWLRFAVANDSAQQRYAILRLTPAHIDSATLFRHDGTEIAQVDYSGILRAPQLFVLNTEPHSQQVYYLRLEGHGKVLLTPKLTDLHPFLIEFRYELFGNGIGIGLLLAVAVANLTMALVLPGTRVFMLLGIYAICNIMTIAASWGYLALHPQVSSLFENPAFIALTHLSMFLATLLSQHFQPSRQREREHRDPILLSLLCGNAIAGIVAIFVPVSVSLPIMLTVVGVSASAITLRALHTYLSSQDSVTYHYLFSRAWLILFVALVALIYLHVDAGLETINLMLLLGTAIEVLMLTVTYSVYRQKKARAHFDHRLQVTALEAESRGGNEALRRINHDLMTPLSAIFGTAEMLKNSQLSPQQRDYVNGLQSASQEMLGFIENILSHPPLAAELSTTPELLYELRPLLQDLIESHQAELLWQNPDTELPTQVIGDPGRLRQLLLHVILVASHYCRETGIALTIEWRDGLWLEFRYRGDKALSLIQAPATTVAPAIQTRAELADQLLETLGGKLRLQSSGQDQFIELSLPLSAWEHQPRLPKRLQLRFRRILIVEPNRTFAMQQKKLCEQWGMIGFVAHTRQQAIALSRNQCLFKTPIDIVLISDTIGQPIRLNQRLHDEARATQLPPPATIFLQESSREFPASACAPFRVMARPSAGQTLKRLIVELLEATEPATERA